MIAVWETINPSGFGVYTFLDPGHLVISLGPLTSGQGIGEVLPQHGACL
jgi:hypothetical protein